MYICLTCNKKFETDGEVAKHSLKCWKEKNPNHKSASTPRGIDTTERIVNEDVINFFASFQKG